MAPQVLSRVCHGTTHPEPWQRDRITVQPALLRGYRRHKVRYADFPAIVPVPAANTSASGSGSESAPAPASTSKTPNDQAEEDTNKERTQSHTVRGTLVTGLTDADFVRLDIFEGSMYKRALVDVQTQGKSSTVDDNDKNKTKKINAAAFTSHADDDTFDGETVRVQTYVWAQPLHQLEPEEWDFEHFVRDRLHIWAGTSGKEDFEGK